MAYSVLKRRFAYTIDYQTIVEGRDYMVDSIIKQSSSVTPTILTLKLKSE